MALHAEDAAKMLAAQAHLGERNMNFQMKEYVHKRRPDGVHIFNLKKMWEKILITARILVAIENPLDIAVVGEAKFAQRAILKFAKHVGATPLAGRFTPGTFTNQIQKAFCEPRILLVNDPRQDLQAVSESSYVNIPVIALCNSDTPLKNVDVVIPCANQNKHTVGLIYWLIARETLRLRGVISRNQAWEIMPDLYFYRDPEDVEKEEKEAEAKRQEVLNAPEEPTEIADFYPAGVAGSAPCEAAPISGEAPEFNIAAVGQQQLSSAPGATGADWVNAQGAAQWSQWEGQGQAPPQQF
jgi:small subunit ribosomal protein SAe